MLAGLQQLPDLGSRGIGGSLGVCGRIKPCEKKKEGQDFHWTKIGNSYHIAARSSRGGGLIKISYLLHLNKDRDYETSAHFRRHQQHKHQKCTG